MTNQETFGLTSIGAESLPKLREQPITTNKIKLNENAGKEEKKSLSQPKLFPPTKEQQQHQQPSNGNLDIQQPRKSTQQDKKPQIQMNNIIQKPKVPGSISTRHSQGGNKDAAESHQGGNPTNQNKQVTQQKLPTLNRSYKMSKSMSSGFNIAGIQKLHILKNHIEEQQQQEHQPPKRKEYHDQRGTKDYKERLQREKVVSLKAIDAFEDQIKNKYEDLYQNRPEEEIVDQIKILENKPLLLDDIYKNDSNLQVNKRKYNQLKYEIEQKSIKLKTLDKQYDDMLEQEKSDLNIKVQHDLKVEELTYIKQQNDEEVFLQDTLKYMAKKRKYYLNVIKQQCADQLRKLKKHQNDINSKTKFKSIRERALNDLNYHLGSTQLQTVSLWDRFALQIEDELSKFDDVKELSQIKQHEDGKLKQRDQQIQQDKMKEFQQKQNARKKEQEAIKKQIEMQQNQVDKEKQNFQKLLEETQLTDIEQLQNHWRFLQETEQKMIYIQKEYQENIERIQKSIGELKQEKKMYEYEAKDGEDTKIPEMTDEVEQQLRKVIDKYQEQEFSYDRQKKLISNICVIIGRILYQLQSKNYKQKNIEVTRQQLLEQISICTLRLEKVLAVLYRKRDQIRVESINTNNEIRDPPEFIGINPKKIAIDDEITKGFNTYEILMNEIENAERNQKKQDTMISFQYKNENSLSLEELDELKHKESESKKIKNPGKIEEIKVNQQ